MSSPSVTWVDPIAGSNPAEVQACFLRSRVVAPAVASRKGVRWGCSKGRLFHSSRALDHPIENTVGGIPTTPLGGAAALETSGSGSPFVLVSDGEDVIAHFNDTNPPFATQFQMSCCLI